MSKQPIPDKVFDRLRLEGEKCTYGRTSTDVNGTT